MKYIIGIDGGGTKTIGYLGTSDGKIIASSTSGPSNYHSVGIDKSKHSISYVLNSLCSKANIEINDIELISLGLAGIDRDEDKKIILEVIKGIGVRGKIILVNDACAALMGAHGREHGIITISGTGSISYGADIKGSTFRAGGWGHIIDDEGSGYDIGRQALSTIFKAYDSRSGKTILTEMVLKHLNLKEVEEIIGYIYCKEITKDHIAKVSPVVFEAAYQKDAAALSILNKAVDSLVNMTETVIENLYFGKQAIEIAIDGGVLTREEYMKNEFHRRLSSKNQKVVISKPLFNGAIGALLIGLNELNVSYSLTDIKKQL